MANYATLKAAIRQVVKTNGNNEITGALLQQSLLAMVNSLGGAFQFVGVAQPSTNPGTPDQNVFYIAGAGTYPNFNNTTVADGYMGVFKYNGSWIIETLQVGKNYDSIIENLNAWVFGKLGFTLGQISTTSGNPTTSTNRAYSPFFDTPKTITFDSSVKVSGRFYDANGNYQTYQEFVSGGTYTPNQNYPLMRLVVSYSNDSTIADASLFNDLVLISDASKHSIARLNEQMDLVVLDVNDIKTTRIQTRFIIGSLSSSNGAEETSDNRVRSVFIKYDSAMKIVCANGYRIGFRWYDENKEFISTTIQWLNGTINVSNYAPVGGVYFRLVGSYSDNATITDAAAFDSNISVRGEKIDIATGKLIEETEKLDENVSDIQQRLLNVENNLTVDISEDFEIGTIETNGVIKANNTRVRSRSSFAIENKKVACQSGYRYAYRWYDANENFITVTYTWQTTETTPEQICPSNAKFFRLVGSYVNNAIISDATLFDVNIQISAPVGEQVTENMRNIELLLSKSGETIAYSSNSSVGNCSILCAKEHTFNDGTPPLYEWFLLCDPADNKLYISRDLATRSYIATFNGDIDQFSFGVLQNGDIIACRMASSLSSGGVDTNRVNPSVFKANENWKTQHTVDFGNSLKPCGWLENCGFRNLPDGTTMFAEYTRITVATANCWKIIGDPLIVSNWVVKKSFVLSGEPDAGFKHCHMVACDHFTGVIYLATGDDNVGAMVFASTDGGDTWTQLREGSELWCRMLMMTFTKDYIYWAQDTPGQHYLFRAERDVNGLLDYSTAIKFVTIPAASGYFASYGQAYIPEFGAVLLLDRQDSSDAGQVLPVRVIDLSDGTIETIGEIHCTNDGGNVGFRTLFSEWYPVGGIVRVGFGFASPTCNKNKVCGNQWPLNDGKDSVNNLYLKVAKDGNNWTLKIGTYYL